MLFVSVNSDEEEKYRDLLNGNGIINPQNSIANIDKILVCKEYEQERYLQIELKEVKEQEMFVAYVEAYFKLTPSEKQKRIR